eukprot:scaffold674135_cov50-Prasinocladus_malaysianus.AAC.1
MRSAEARWPWHLKEGAHDGGRVVAAVAAEGGGAALVVFGDESRGHTDVRHGRPGAHPLVQVGVGDVVVR